MIITEESETSSETDSSDDELDAFENEIDPLDEASDESEAAAAAAAVDSVMSAAEALLSPSSSWIDVGDPLRESFLKSYENGRPVQPLSPPPSPPPSLTPDETRSSQDLSSLQQPLAHDADASTLQSTVGVNGCEKTELSLPVERADDEGRVDVTPEEPSTLASMLASPISVALGFFGRERSGTYDDSENAASSIDCDDYTGEDLILDCASTLSRAASRVVGLWAALTNNTICTKDDDDDEINRIVGTLKETWSTLSVRVRTLQCVMTRGSVDALKEAWKRNPNLARATGVALNRVLALRKGIEDGDMFVVGASVALAGTLIFLALSRVDSLSVDPTRVCTSGARDGCDGNGSLLVENPYGKDGALRSIAICNEDFLLVVLRDLLPMRPDHKLVLCTHPRLPPYISRSSDSVNADDAMVMVGLYDEV